MYVDDELDNLSSFKASFRRVWNVFTAQNEKEAFNILQENEIQIIVSDQRMPEIKGVDLLTKIRKKYPESIRILLTGYADLEVVIDAINKGEIYRYFSKPWNNEILHEAFVHCSEIYQQKKELRIKDEELKKSYRELESFVYSASHDLRAPLVSVLGVVKLAKIQMAQGKEPVDYLNHIEESVQTLDKFVKNIINYYQNMKQAVQASEINIYQMVDEVFLTYKHYEGAENIVLHNKVDSEATIFTDELRLKIIVNNLITNALKYHDSTKKDQWVKVHAEINKTEFLINVEDNGKGIAKDQVEKVFEMFYTGTNGKSKGTGIGLHIVKEAAEKISGTVSVKSEQGQGTTFTIKAKNEKEL